MNPEIPAMSSVRKTRDRKTAYYKDVINKLFIGNSGILQHSLISVLECNYIVIIP